MYGDYRRPGESRTFHSRRTYAIEATGDAKLEISTWTETDASPIRRAFLFIGNDAFEVKPGLKRWSLLKGEARDHALMQLYSGAPQLMLAELLRRYAAEPDRINFERSKDGYWARFEFPADATEPPTSSWILTLAGDRFGAVSRHHSNPLFGDAFDSAGFGYAGRDSFPSAMSLRVTERDHFWENPSRLVSRTVHSSTGFFPARPTVFDIAPSEDFEVSGISTIGAVAPGIWSLDMTDLDTRSLIVEFSDHLAVIEAAESSSNGEHIVDAAKNRWPDKPIRYFLFSHHHAHSAGGARAMIGEDATIVTTAGNEQMVNDAARRCFVRRRDRLGRWDKKPRVQRVEGQFDLKDGSNHLVAIDIGSPADSTDEFVVFWFPRQRLVFEMEHGWEREKGRIRAAGRANNLLRSLRERGIAPTRFIQASPIRDLPAELSRTELVALVRTRRR